LPLSVVPLDAVRSRPTPSAPLVGGALDSFACVSYG
jgi:hypothetical protein